MGLNNFIDLPTLLMHSKVMELKKFLLKEDFKLIVIQDIQKIAPPKKETTQEIVIP